MKPERHHLLLADPPTVRPIKIYVGSLNPAHTFLTTRATLMKSPGLWQSVMKDEAGNYWIDADYDSFLPAMVFLRTGELRMPTDRSQVKQMVVTLRKLRMISDSDDKLTALLEEKLQVAKAAQTEAAKAEMQSGFEKLIKNLLLINDRPCD